eukprot:724929-Amorphochlora_amoeboformis.AAC.2
MQRDFSEDGDIPTDGGRSILGGKIPFVLWHSNADRCIHDFPGWLIMKKLHFSLVKRSLFASEVPKHAGHSSSPDFGALFRGDSGSFFLFVGKGVGFGGAGETSLSKG